MWEHVCRQPLPDPKIMFDPSVFASLSDVYTNKTQNDFVVTGFILRLQSMLLGSDLLTDEFLRF